EDVCSFDVHLLKEIRKTDRSGVQRPVEVSYPPGVLKMHEIGNKYPELAHQLFAIEAKRERGGSNPVHQQQRGTRAADQIPKSPRRDIRPAFFHSVEDWPCVIEGHR